MTSFKSKGLLFLSRGERSDRSNVRADSFAARMSHFMEINLIGSSDPRRDVTNIGVCIWARALADPLDLIRFDLDHWTACVRPYISSRVQ